MKKLMIISIVTLLSACDNNDSSSPAPAPPPEANASFEITVVNLTVAQPFSPLAVLIGDSNEKAFSIGSAASSGLELLAESGDNSQLLTDLDSSAEISGMAPLLPGASETLSLELDTSDTSGMMLTFVTMLVHTNDAFTAINGADISGLAVDESLVFNTLSYDAGTELNTETSATIPGPDFGGEGFNALRDDVQDQVTLHGGVVTTADGLSSSDLSQQHRWDNPVARVRITRSQ